MIKNRDQVVVNSELNHTDTRHMLISPTFREFDQIPEWSVLFRCVFHMLPSCIKIESDNPKKFKLIVQKCIFLVVFR